jgi:hypothetical protein
MPLNQANARGLILVGVVVTIALIGTWFGRPVMVRVSECIGFGGWASLSVGLRVATPLVALCAVVAVLSPGALLVASTTREADWSTLPALAMAASLVLLAGAATVVKLVVLPLSSTAFFTLLILVDVGLLALLVLRHRRINWRRPDATCVRRWVWASGLVVVLMVVLLPKFFWENFNPDGLEAMECGRLLMRQVLPVWEPTTELHGFPGITTIAFLYPVNWFVELFGPYEIAARLPFLLYLSVLFLTIVGLIETDMPRRLGVLTEGIIALSLATFTVTMAYSASYDPYCADIAQPAARATLLMVFFLAAFQAYWTSRMGRFMLFGSLTFLTSPSGSVLLGLMGAAGFVLEPTERWRRVRLLAVTAGLCVVLAVGWRLAAGGSEHSPDSLLRRLLYLKLTDFRRVAFLIVPCGFLPAIGLLWFRGQDAAGRTLTLVCLVYFAFFAPVMILPVVVFWRMALRDPHRFRRIAPLAVVTTAVALYVSVPDRLALDQGMRQFGWATDLQLGDYDTDYQNTLRRANRLFTTVFPVDWDLDDGAAEWSGQPFCWVHYAQRPKPPGIATDFVAQSTTRPVPAGFVKIGETETDALYARSAAVFLQQKYRSRRTDFAARWYRIPRTTLFKHLGEPAGAMDIDLRPLLRPLFPGAVTK